MKSSAKLKSVGAQEGQGFSLDLLRAWREMLLIRRFEEKAGQLYGMGHIGGFCHLYIGQEAVTVGLQLAQHEVDTVVASYRDHGQMLAMGMDPNGVMAELTGRSGGLSKGKGGSMHMFSREKKFYGGHGIVGAQVPIGTGLAFSHKYKNDGGVCVTYLGDGAVNQGQVYESFNMAALWKLPVVYVIENNHYAMGTSKNRHTVGDLYRRGEPYGIMGHQVDGMDVTKVFEAADEALAFARSGRGPVILEMDTYRYRGHSMSDPGKYRSKEEVEMWKTTRDPIETLRARLLGEGLMTDDKLKRIEKEIKEIVTRAADFALASPEPDPSELYTDILIES
ncbi:MAG: pyruvate dehydrogenase (acetyl-transferring) E1 component subunit alpha [Alphaproteobacteria bacterium]|nr:pyruvate dehydrogenase (acetyl-transferring) E1 component subunit alpha [Alphaproteobacteria bacterium]